MTLGTAWREGVARVSRAPALIIGLWAATLLLAAPLALSLGAHIERHLGASLAAETAADAVNIDWWNEFLAQASGIGQTFVPSIIGFAAVLRNLSAIADAQPVPPAIAGALAAYLVLSIFLSGGVVDRLARDRRVGIHGFFSACGGCFFRLLRLGAMAAAVYGLLFVWLHPWLFEAAYGLLARDLTVERTAFLYRLSLYALFTIVLIKVNIVFDYARIRLVVEDRHSAVGAFAAGLRFFWRQPWNVFGLYSLNALVFVGVVAFYGVAAPGAGGGAVAWLALAIGQLYLVLRVIVRLLFVASQTALFQGRLAHAVYTARPLPAWPDSPAAEAIRPE